MSLENLIKEKENYCNLQSSCDNCKLKNERICNIEPCFLTRLDYEVAVLMINHAIIEK